MCAYSGTDEEKGYKEYNTGREYMALMGDRHKNKDEEIELDGVGGVSILVKADVHRSGECAPNFLLTAPPKRTAD